MVRAGATMNGPVHPVGHCNHPSIIPAPVAGVHTRGIILAALTSREPMPGEISYVNLWNGWGDMFEAAPWTS
jgi:hypothetical protein